MKQHTRWVGAALIALLLCALPAAAQSPRVNGFPLLPAITDNSVTTCSSTNLPSAGGVNSGGFVFVINTAATVVVMCRSNGTNWIQASSSAAGITQLTGDGTAGPGSASQPLTLATVNSNVGTFGDSTHVGQFTVNAKGLVTAASSVAISGGGSSPLTTKGDLFGFSTVNARIPIGADNTVLTADSSQTLGLRWASPGSSSLNIDVGGTLIGTRPALNFISGNGITQLCTDNSGANRVDCTPALDTSVAATRACLEASCSTGLSFTRFASANYTATGSPTFMSYTINQTLTFVFPTNCDGADTVNIDGLGRIPLQKLVSGSLVAVAINDCVANVPFLALAVGSPVTAYRIYP